MEKVVCEELEWEKKEDIDDTKAETAKLIGDLRRIQSEASCLTYWLGIFTSRRHLLTPEIKAIPQDIMKIQARLETLQANLYSCKSDIP